jgi:hypothetical protein
VYIPYVKGVSERFKRTGNRTTSGLSSKLNTLLAVQSWKPGREEIRNRRHSASTVFPLNVAEATLAKKADL